MNLNSELSNKQNKILFSVGFGRLEGKFKQLSSPRFKEYAEYYGFDYHAITQYSEIKGRKPHWIKIHYILKLLEQLNPGDIIVYLDADIAIVCGDIELTTQKTISFAKDSSGIINSGVFAVQVNEFSRRFFQAVWQRTDCDEHVWQDNLAVLKLLEEISPQDKEKHLEILPNCLNVTLVEGEYPPYDKYLTNPCKESIRFRHFAGMQPWYKRYFSQPIDFTGELDEGKMNFTFSSSQVSILPFNLKPINLIIFPDWLQPEEELRSELEKIIRALINHYNSSQMTLLIDTSGVSEEEADLFLLSIAMNLLMQEDIDVTETLDITLVGQLDEIQWKALLPRIHACIPLRKSKDQEVSLVNTSSYGKFREKTITFCELDKLGYVRLQQFLLNLSHKLFQQRKWEEAIEQYQIFLEVQVGEPDVYWCLSECFRYLYLSDKVISTLQEGILLHPKDARLHFSLIVHLQVSGYIQEALSRANIASELLPNDYTFVILKNLLVPTLYQNQAEITYYRQRFSQGLQNLIQQTLLETPEDQKNALAGTRRYTNFYLSYQAQNDRDLQRQYGEFMHQIMAANYPQWVEPLSMPPLEQNHKIRIGYISAYLHSYSGTLWLTGWLRHADKENFEIYCYYTGNTPDYITQEFQKYSDKFYHIPHNLEAACEQIMADQLHILVFPEIGMDAPTLQMAALRLAPVQCTAWGHPVTSGLPTVDYFLSSELMEPEDAQEHYTETLIRLPNIGVSYPKPYIPPRTKTRADYQLPDEAVIYLCCQAPFKYLPQYDYILVEIARRVPQAQFLFLRGKLLQLRLKRVFSAVGLKYEDYCLFLTIPERLDYLMINLLSDVYLDTLDWSGGNTSLEAIACHLPIVTRPGELMRCRHSDSFLKMIGVTDTIAEDEADYIEIAIKLGLDSAWRRDIAERMKENHDRLFDDKTCVLGLEAFYQQVFQEKLSPLQN
jgi:predicted O-linked N-acetylglucosamine transferase (SPINDLY family)